MIDSSVFFITSFSELFQSYISNGILSDPTYQIIFIGFLILFVICIIIGYFFFMLFDKEQKTYNINKRENNKCKIRGLDIKNCSDKLKNYHIIRMSLSCFGLLGLIILIIIIPLIDIIYYYNYNYK